MPRTKEENKLPISSFLMSTMREISKWTLFSYVTVPTVASQKSVCTLEEVDITDRENLS